MILYIMSVIWRCVKGVTICMLWYTTILSGFYVLYCPLIPLLLFSSAIYRRLVDKVFALWELYPVALFQLICGTKIVIRGDKVCPKEMAVIIMNHRTRLDWNFIWLCLFQATRPQQAIKRSQSVDAIIHNPNMDGKQDGGPLKQSENWKIFRSDRTIFRTVLATFNQQSRLKFVLKDEIKNVPGLGWNMQLNYCLYFRRSWSVDRAAAASFLNHHRRLQYKYQLLIFPEGTDLTRDNLARSDTFAFRNNLQRYDYVLHPRTTGFVYITSKLQEQNTLDALYDITVAYPGKVVQSEISLLLGHVPDEVHFHIKRYPAPSVPTSEDALRSWLTTRWQEKELRLRNFYDNGNFDSCANPRLQNAAYTEAVVAFIFWSLLNFGFSLALYNFYAVKVYAVIMTLAFLTVSHFYDGFYNFERRIYNLRNGFSNVS